jgi:hypothetical protein
MEQASRHQCHIYDGAPSQGLAKLAAAAKKKLEEGYRCMYVNSAPMVAGMGSYLAAIGVDVYGEVSRNSMVFSSDQSHLIDGRFDVDSMLDKLEAAVNQASADGYKGLWAAGDMSWEFGPQKNLARLIEYEWMLEEIFRRQPTMQGVCQYHASTLPREALRDGLMSHSSIFINDTLSRMNPHYIRTESLAVAELMALHRPELDKVIAQLCSLG